MFWILNRIRGGGFHIKYGSHICGFIFALIMRYIFELDNRDIFVMYVLWSIGESFGWGKWFIQIGERDPYYNNDPDVVDNGKNNGIHFFANLICPEKKCYLWYARLALVLRGMIWFGLPFMYLISQHIISLEFGFYITLYMGITFPISVELGRITQKYISKPNFNGYWEHAEVIYGLFLDILLIYLNANF